MKYLSKEPMVFYPGKNGEKPTTPCDHLGRKRKFVQELRMVPDGKQSFGEWRCECGAKL